MPGILFWLCAMGATFCWLFVLYMGGLELLHQVQGADTEHTPLQLALAALAPAVLLTGFAVTAWHGGEDDV